ncbi:MAG: hypothetical protein CSA32_02535 [Desulfobulbus propionicus]|nr:MAG: hypothetical protein CSA32_02535 [Desulfobulbus propionicus]
MIKRLFNGFLLVSLIGVSSYYLLDNVEKSQKIEDLLPRDTVVYLRMNNLADTCTHLVHSPVGRQLTGARLKKLLMQCGVGENDTATVHKAAAFFQYMVGHPLFPMLLHADSGLALLPPEEEYDDVLEYLLDNVLFVARATVALSPDLVLAKLSDVKKDIKKTRYYEKEVVCVTLESGESFAFAVVEDKVLLSGGTRTLYRSLDLYEQRNIRPKENLSREKEYRKLAGENTGKQKHLLYCNLSQLTEVLDIFSSPPARRWTFADNNRLYMRHQTRGDTDQLQVILQGHIAELDGSVQTYIQAMPEKDKQLHHLDEGVVAYLWTNWLDLKGLWRSLSRNPAPHAAAALFYIGQQLQRHTGHDIDFFTGLFGRQGGFVLYEAPKKKPSSLPMVLLFIDVESPIKIHAFFNRILAPFATTQYTFAGYEAVSMLMADGLIQPAYAVIGHRLFIADNIALLQRFVKKQKKRLVNDSGFKKVDPGFRKKSNLLAYARIDQFNRQLEALCTWWITSLGQVGAMEPEFGDLLVNKLMTPLFQSLNHVRAQAIRMTAGEDSIRVDIVLHSF